MRRILTTGLFAIILLFFSHMNEASAKEFDRATWIWNPWELVTNETKIIDFLNEKQVTKVYLQIDEEVSQDVYKRFIEKANEANITVFALDGAPNWILKGGYKSQDNLFQWLSTYQQTHSTASFAGVHLDVEPYLAKQWTTNRKAAITSFQILLTRAKTSANQLRLPLEADIPFWYDEVTYKNGFGGGNLAEWIIRKMDGVTIMAYIDSDKQIINQTKLEMFYSLKWKTPITIAVETIDSHEGDDVTFYQEGERSMNRVLLQVKEFYQKNNYHSGEAIHHVDSWMTLGK
ncbi:amidase [Lysinibacillus sp. BW-2-10]|uniref:amidase n=1 Tax=Lysinibacillus sp. BW-2-10 TaxID=2590030 RepID=UPI00117D9D61|nr:amidase [Lysinibacillus sp. BW-2-10]TSI04752.1 amidase [Lysinibacillus sp. BW-2-10]